MHAYNKVIWQDGMLIHQNHLQQQDMYYENLLNNYHLVQNSYGWGLISMELDNNYLKLNKIVLKECSGIFPNGTLFRISQHDQIPLVIDIPKNTVNKLVYLALPVLNKCNVNSKLVTTSARYTAFDYESSDYCLGTEQKKIITVGKVNLSLIMEQDENKDQFILLPVLRVLSANDGIVIDKSYIPPSLLVKSSHLMQDYINKILGFLTEYIDLKMSLVDEKRYSSNQLKNLLILQTVNKFKYLFELSQQDPNLTPYNLLNNIVSFVASISIFSPNHNLSKIKISYDHLDLNGSFCFLIDLIQSIFEEIKEQTAVELEFKLEMRNMYSLRMHDIQSIENSDLLIGITFNATIPDNAKSGIFDSIKLASILGIKQVLSLHISGVGVIPVSTVPYYVSYDDQTLYFSLVREGALWTQIMKDKDIAIYVGSSFADIRKVKLWYIPKNR